MEKFVEYCIEKLSEESDELAMVACEIACEPYRCISVTVNNGFDEYWICSSADPMSHPH